MARRRRPDNRPPRRKRRGPKVQRAAVATLPDTVEARFEEATRKAVELLVQMRAKGLGLSESERVLERVLEQHPEHAELFEKASEWVVTGNPDSPFMHVGVHHVVEQRVVTREIGRFDASIPWHEAVHAAAESIGPEIFGTDE